MATAILLLSAPTCRSGPAGPVDGIERFGGGPLRARGAATLREVASSRGIGIGAAVDRLFRDDAEGVEFKTVLGREFSVLTPENDMKHRNLQPARGVFRFARADSLVAFAESNGMLVRGHTLVWHTGTAAWVTNGSWTQEQARQLLIDHVRTVVAHYRGRVFSWDVVNEAVNEDGSARSTVWSRLIGPDYIALAFRTAHEADPDVLLFYNDNRIEGMNQKSDSVYALVSRLVAAGVPIHGIGMEGHFVVGRVPARESLAANLARFAALGLKVHFTEVDVRIPQPTTPEQLRIQAENYRDVFAVCLEQPACQMVVTWGVSDRESWIPKAHPGWGAPLLLDEAYRPKDAYRLVYDLLSRVDGAAPRLESRLRIRN